MKKRNKWLLGISFTGILACSLLLPKEGLYAEHEAINEQEQGMSYSDQTGLFLSMDEDGNISYVKPELANYKETETVPETKDTQYELKSEKKNTSKLVDVYDDMEEASKALKQKSMYRSSSDYAIYANDNLRETTQPAIVRFKFFYNDKGVLLNTDYKDKQTGASGYLNAAYAADGAYIGTSGSKVTFMISGVIGEVDASKVEIIPFNQNLNLSIYRVNDGYLYHNISTNVYGNSAASTQLMGKAPSYLKANTKYYSYDGHYFYDDFSKMSMDYKNNTTKNSVNYGKAFYNYYQYLSHRTKTTFTAEDFDKRINTALNGKTSKMTNTGDYFICNQNEFSVNASLMYGLAINESAYGQSKIANDKNNLFGHGAVDSNPYWGANGYKTVSDSIKYHAQYFVDKGYVDPADWRYYGPHLGDKASGMNVKYASDPYWGEKAAAHSYYLERDTGKNDSSKYSMAIFNDNSYLNIRKEPSTSSKALYNTLSGSNKNTMQFPFVIIQEVEGDSVNGNKKWYKIQADGSLNENRTDLNKERKYDFSHDYGYISAEMVDLVYQGNSSSTSNGGTQCKVEPTPTPEPTPEPEYKKGDVNGDGKITPADYVKVKNHIMGKSKLTGASLKAADMNGDGKISPADYVKIKNTIMGK